jgi:hypothetical protein
VAVLALGFVLALVVGAAGVGGNAKAFGAGTTLTVLSGDVTVRHGSGDFAPAADGEVLSEGDAIHTGPDGRAVLTYFEGSTVTIEPATELAIDSANSTADGGTVVLMTQSVGRTWHVVTKLITSGSKYEVRTPASTASVRGTEFEVDADDATTTVTTTEGTVMAHVEDPVQPGAAVDVPVSAGMTQTQPRNAPPAPARTAPEPERKVTVTVGSTNTLIVDPLGRANGVTKDGKVVVQTPGAQVRRKGDTIVVTLPNLPDGNLATQVDKKDANDDADVNVTTKVEEKGHATVVDDKAVVKSGSDKKSAGLELKRTTDGTTEGRPLDDTEKKSLPAGKTANPQAPSRADHTASPAPSHRAAPSAERTASSAPKATHAPEVTRGVENASRSPESTPKPTARADTNITSPSPLPLPSPTVRTDATPKTDATLRILATPGLETPRVEATPRIDVTAPVASSPRVDPTAPLAFVPRVDVTLPVIFSVKTDPAVKPEQPVKAASVEVQAPTPKPEPNARPVPVVRPDPTPRHEQQQKPADRKPERPAVQPPENKAPHRR